MKRAVKISLKFATGAKLRRLDHLCRKYRKLTNLYIDHIWEHGGKLDAATLNAIVYPTLGYRQRSDCLKYALEIVASTRASAKALGKIASKPYLSRSVKFSSLTATIEPGKGIFDYVLKISSTVQGSRIVLPFKSHMRLNYWLAKPGARILDGCIISGETAVLWIDVPLAPPKVEGDELGIDIGYNKLLTDSDGNVYGERIKELCQKVCRRKPGSLGKLRSRRERDQYIRWTVKMLPWARLKTIAVENLKYMKHGKKPNRGKQFRKRLAPWSYRQALARIGQLAEEHRVILHSVNPRNTSKECLNCGMVSSENRRGEKFCCVRCGHEADADKNGAQNIIARTRGNSRQPMVAEPSASFSKV